MVGPDRWTMAWCWTSRIWDTTGLWTRPRGSIMDRWSTRISCLGPRASRPADLCGTPATFVQTAAPTGGRQNHVETLRCRNDFPISYRIDVDAMAGFGRAPRGQRLLATASSTKRFLNATDRRHRRCASRIFAESIPCCRRPNPFELILRRASDGSVVLIQQWFVAAANQTRP